MIKLLSLFSGIGAFEKALTNIGVDYELVGYSEVNDGYGKAVQEVYEVLHDAKGKYMGLVQDVDGEKLGEIDILTHGSPCQDFSMAGERKGGNKGSGTQSSLMWETVRIVKESKPKIVIWENVKGVLFKNNIENFNKYLNKMEEMGYTNHYQILTSDDFGVPQKRERVFVVSEKIDKEFVFPRSLKNKVTLRDILELKVDEKYTVPRAMIKNWYDKKPPFGDRFTLLKYDDVGYTLVAKGGRAVITNNYILKYESDYELISEYKGKKAIKQILENNLEVRALTPSEYWRMMGWDDISIRDIAELGISDARMYKMSGNSIVVNVLEGIFKNLQGD